MTDLSRYLPGGGGQRDVGGALCMRVYPCVFPRSDESLLSLSVAQAICRKYVVLGSKILIRKKKKNQKSCSVSSTLCFYLSLCCHMNLNVCKIRFSDMYGSRTTGGR